MPRVLLMSEVLGYLAHKKQSPPPVGPPQGPGYRLTVGSYGGLFLMSEVPLYHMQANQVRTSPVARQGCLAHEKTHTPRTLR